MNSAIVKKQQEKAFLLEVRSLYPDFPVGTIESDEAPDFRVVGDGPVVGVEVVRFIRGQEEQHGSAMRRNAVLRRQVASRAQAIFEETHSMPVWVCFTWNDNPQLERSRIEEYAAAVTDLVAVNVPHTLHEGIKIWGYELDGNPLQRVLCYLDIKRLKPEYSSCWGPIEAAFIGIEVDAVQGLITSKEGKLASYRQKCVAAWLLIVADAQHLSSMGELDEDVNEHDFETSFDRVLFYTTENRSVTELRIARE